MTELSGFSLDETNVRPDDGLGRDDGGDLPGVHSTSSDDYYNQEPFAIFKNRVDHLFSGLSPTINVTASLSTDIIRPTTAPGVRTTLIDRRGGGYNRITEVVQSISMRYIFRTPRYYGNDVTRSTMILQYLGSRTHLPIPTVYSYSALADNVYDRYILMNCLPGENLSDIWKLMKLSERMELAGQFAGLIADVHELQIPGEDGLIGLLCAEYDGEAQQRKQNRRESDHNNAHRLVVKTYPYDRSLEHDSASSPNLSDQSYSTPHTLRSFILSQFELYLTTCARADDLVDPLEDVYRRLLVVALRLLDTSRFPEVDVACRSVFVHKDLWPRNVLVRTDHSPSNDINSRSTSVTSSNGIEITGILDWDDAQALPPLAAYECPSWLWTSDYLPHSTTSSINWPFEALSDPDPDLDSDHAMVREKFINTIERRIPGYMAIIRRARRFGIPRLMWFATRYINSTWQEDGIDMLEELADSLDR